MLNFLEITIKVDEYEKFSLDYLDLQKKFFERTL